MIENRYELLECVGEGGEARVWKAYDHAIDRLVAIKEIVAAPDEEADALREARAVARLSHPNIITLYDVIEHDRPLLIMEYVEGISLREALHQLGALDVNAAVAIFTQAALSVEYAHNHGVLHLDIKPDNILLLPSGKVKLADFGIARLRIEEEGPAAIKGTLAYCAPEILNGRFTEKADIFSLGVVLYEMLTGENPFYAPTPRGVVAKLKEYRPLPPSELNPSIPAELDAVVLKSIEKSPPRRYEDVLRFRLKVEPFFTGESYEAEVASLFEHEAREHRLRLPFLHLPVMPGVADRTLAGVSATAFFAGGAVLLGVTAFQGISLATAALVCGALAFAHPAYGAGASLLVISLLLFFRTFQAGLFALGACAIAYVALSRLSRKGIQGLLGAPVSLVGLEPLAASLISARLSFLDFLSFMLNSLVGFAVYELLAVPEHSERFARLVPQALSPFVSLPAGSADPIGALTSNAFLARAAAFLAVSVATWAISRATRKRWAAALLALTAVTLATAIFRPLLPASDAVIDPILQRYSLSLFLVALGSGVATLARTRKARAREDTE